jgi:hypothetical protein
MRKGILEVVKNNDEYTESLVSGLTANVVVLLGDVNNALYFGLTETEGLLLADRLIKAFENKDKEDLEE